MAETILTSSTNITHGTSNNQTLSGGGTMTRYISLKDNHGCILIPKIGLIYTGTNDNIYSRFDIGTSNLPVYIKDGVFQPITSALSTSLIPNLNASKITEGTLPITRGGTGKTSIAANKIWYASANNTLAETSISSLGRNILNASDGATVANLKSADSDKLNGQAATYYATALNLTALGTRVTTLETAAATGLNYLGAVAGAASDVTDKLSTVKGFKINNAAVNFKKGDLLKISSDGYIGTVPVQAGDILIYNNTTSKASSAIAQTDFDFIQANVDIATQSTLGLVKVGTNLSITNGAIGISDSTIKNKITVTDGSDDLSWGNNIVIGTVNNTALTAKLPAKPTLSGGAEAVSGKYVSGVTVSDHTITVTQANLPTANVSSDLIIASSTTATTDANAAISTNGNVYLNHKEGTSISKSLKILGTGAATVKTTYSDSKHTLEIYAPANTDAKVSQVKITTSTNAEYPLLIKKTTTENPTEGVMYKASGLSYNPSTDTITIGTAAVTNLKIGNQTLENYIKSLFTVANLEAAVTEIIKTKDIKVGTSPNYTIDGLVFFDE